MIREELEFRIARYADGDLTEAECLGVEAELAGDAEARDLLAEYQTLRTAIEDAAGPALPKVHWDRLEQLLSNAVTRSAAVSAAGGESEASGGASEADARDGPFAGVLGVEQEFAVACLADGSLSSDRRAEVEQLLAGDARARALFDEYRDLDAATKALVYSNAPPVMEWDRLARQISHAVDAGANSGLPEDVERQLAAYAEGTLPAEERETVESRLATDPSARLMEYEYRNLDAALGAVSSIDRLPTVDWERFAGRISAAIDRSAERPRKPHAGGYRILNWLRSPSRLALAASVLMGVALVARLMHGGAGPVVRPILPGVAVTPTRVESIAVLTPEPPAGGAQSEISIGPPSVAQAGIDDEAGDDDGVISRTPRAFVASGRSTSSEADALPAIPF